jgi:hypothetical protein
LDGQGLWGPCIKKQLKILKHWSADLKTQECQNGGSAEVKRQRRNNLLLFLPGQKKKKITQTFDGQGLWGLCITKAVKNFNIPVVSTS